MICVGFQLLETIKWGCLPSYLAKHHLLQQDTGSSCWLMLSHATLVCIRSKYHKIAITHVHMGINQQYPGVNMQKDVEIPWFP